MHQIFQVVDIYYRYQLFIFLPTYLTYHTEVTTNVFT